MEKTNNHIEEYFLKSDNNSQAIASKELFRDDKIMLRTDISNDEIIIINKLMFNNSLLESCGLEQVFDGFINNFMKLKVSKDRKSRQEFVSINKSDKTDEVMAGMGNISSILNARK